MAVDSEVWKPVVGWEDLYEVSDHGRVRNRKTGRCLTPQTSRRYPSVLLKTTGRQKRAYPHRLILEAFVGPPPEGKPFALHWNDDPRDNRLVNLRWGSPTENRLDSVRTGRHNNARKTHCKWGHEYTPENTQWVGGGTRRNCRTCRKAADAARDRTKKKKVNV